MSPRTKTTDSATRRRRTQPQAREAILNAARELFAERGYANTTTRAIAQLAEASEVLLYRYFNSKAELFEQAVSGPFNQLMEEAHALLEDTDPGVVAHSRQFCRKLYELFVADRRLIMALISTRAYEAAPADDAGRANAFRQYFERAEGGLTDFYDDKGMQPGFSPAFAARLAFAAVFSTALLQDWLFRDVGDRDAIMAAVSEFVTRALYAAPVAEFPSPARYQRHWRRTRLGRQADRLS
jgi:AcrR family transcriptional regulator